MSSRVSDHRPRASIVLATHARPDFLADCVRSIAAAMRDGDELIVMECCNPGAAEIVEPLLVPVTHVSESHARKCSKLNAGIRLANGEVILVTDDDCRVEPGWVDAMVAPFVNPAVGVAFGPSIGLSSAPGGSPASVLPAGPAPPELWNYAHGLSMAGRRSAIVDVGGFDERLGPGAPVHGEEGDLVLRLAEHGWGCEIVDAPPVHHLEWRDDRQTRRNLLVYARGGGAYLGAALRRAPGRTVKPLLLRLSHEVGYWRDHKTRGHSFGPRMTLAFVAGLARGVALGPRRFFEAPHAVPASRGRPRVLWITDEAPDRNQGGGNIRQAMLLDGLHDRFDVTLLLAGRLNDDVTRARLSAVLEVPPPRPRPPRGRNRRRARDLWHALGARRPSGVVGATRIRRVLRPVVDRVADDFDAVVVHHLYLAPLLPRRRRAHWVLHLFDVASERTRQERATEPGRRQRWLLQREIAKAAREERAMVAAYDAVIVVSGQDAVCVAGPRGERARGPVVVVPNGVDTASPPTPLPAEPTVLLPGTLDYRPNALGAIWFCDEVLPLVRRTVPAVRFALVGRRPVPDVVALARRPGVELHADVPRMEPWFAWARVVVVPLLVGTGTRLKALEGMAQGRAVVGTTIGLDGLGLIDGLHARVTDDPTAMADAIIELLVSDAAAARVATAGRAHVEANFGWQPITDRLADALESAATRARDQRRAFPAARR